MNDNNDKFTFRERNAIASMIFIAISVVVYLISTLFALDFNPRDWSMVSKIVFITIEVIFAIVVYGIFNSKPPLNYD